MADLGHFFKEPSFVVYFVNFGKDVENDKGKFVEKLYR